MLSCNKCQKPVVVQVQIPLYSTVLYAVRDRSFILRDSYIDDSKIKKTSVITKATLVTCTSCSLTQEIQECGIRCSECSQVNGKADESYIVDGSFIICKNCKEKYYKKTDSVILSDAWR